MKKNLLLLSSLFLTLATVNAQEVTTQEVEKQEAAFSKWSIDLNGGINKPTTPFTDGYYTDRVSPFHVDLGVRYMFNQYFGLKADIGYDEFKDGDGSMQFESQYYRTNLQGVANLGRILNFESWTKSLNLQFHTGLGYSQLRNTNGAEANDNMMNMILGFTGQVKLSNRIALNADFSMINNTSQDYTFDGFSRNPDLRGFDGTLYNATLGLSVYLGKNKTHADWYFEKSIADRVSSLENRVGDIETGLADSDKDGVPDMYDLEPNSITGVAVDTKGRSIDRNQNGVPDELESYLDKTYGKGSTSAYTSNSSNQGTIKELINGGYVNVYFDFNSDKPTDASVDGINFLVKYMNANPNSTANLVGYADEIGNSDYNKDLSQRRAEAVKAIVIGSGINASRLSVTGNGEDTSVNKDSKGARQIVRRVTFTVN